MLSSEERKYLVLSRKFSFQKTKARKAKSFVNCRSHFFLNINKSYLLINLNDMFLKEIKPK